MTLGIVGCTFFQFHKTVALYIFNNFFLFSFANYIGQGHQNSICQLLWALLPVGGNRSTRRKPTAFGRALTFTLFA
jgi:hypothetical protein